MLTLSQVFSRWVAQASAGVQQARTEGRQNSQTLISRAPKVCKTMAFGLCLKVLGHHFADSWGPGTDSDGPSFGLGYVLGCTYTSERVTSRPVQTHGRDIHSAILED